MQSAAKKAGNQRHEAKRVLKPVSFNRETEQELLAFAESVDFSRLG